MLKRRLRSLDYLDWDKVNVNDTEHYRKVVVWLEDQKIRFYMIHERAELRKITSNDWQKTYSEYLSDLDCPVKSGPPDQLEWLLGLAVQLEYDARLDKCTESRKKKNGKQESNVADANWAEPLANVDYDGKNFKVGIDGVAKLLNIVRHPDRRITLEACSKVICKRLNPSALANPDRVVAKGKSFPFTKIDLGYNTGDRVLNNAAKALTLLYIHDLRKLQTKINEAIVMIQTITANPKTDTRLGKVGI